MKQLSTAAPPYPETENTLYDFRNFLASGDQNIPHLPEVAQRILACGRNPQANAGQLAAIISSDAAIATQILKTVNAAYYGFPKQITSIKHAVVLLGFHEVSNLAIGLALTSMLTQQRSEPFYRDFRRHSLGAANFALLLAGKFNYPDKATAYTGGLLHDFGILMLFSWRPAVYKEVIALSLAERQSLLASERQIIGFDHLEAGKLVGHLWHLPEQLLNCMQYHNSVKTTKLQENIFLALVDLANILSYQAGFPATAGVPAPGLPRITWTVLQRKLPGLRRTLLEEWITEMTPTISSALAVFTPKSHG